MAMFRGISTINMDGKGRITLPRRWHDELLNKSQGKLVITIDAEDQCLLLYQLSIWEEIEQKIEKLPSFIPAVRRIQRLLIGHATELEMDSIGRILLPPPLREYAVLHRQVILVGQGKKFELWDRDIWQEKRSSWIRSGEGGGGEVPPELQNLSL